MYKNVVITGGNGFIGSNFNFGAKLSRKDCNLLDFKETLAVFSLLKPDAIIHTAGTIGGVLGNREEKGRYCYENVTINTNVLEAARLVGVKRVLSFSSTCAYPEYESFPYKEENFHNGLPHRDHYGYAYAKRMMDIMSRTYNEQYGVNYNCIVLGNVYGPKDHFNKESGHVIPSLIGKCYDAWKERRPFIVWGSGKPLRQLIYVEDVVNICKWMLDNFIDPPLMNICNPKEYSILEIATIIRDAFDKNIPMEFNSSKPDGQFRKPVSIEIFQEQCPSYNFISLEEGIKQTVKWYKENKEK